MRSLTMIFRSLSAHRLVRNLAVGVLVGFVAVLSLASDCDNTEVHRSTTEVTIPGWGVSHLHKAFADTSALPNDIIEGPGPTLLNCPGLHGGSFEKQNQRLIIAGEWFLMDATDPAPPRVFARVDNGSITFRLRKLNELTCNFSGPYWDCTIKFALEYRAEYISDEVGACIRSSRIDFSRFEFVPNGLPEIDRISAWVRDHNADQFLAGIDRRVATEVTRVGGHPADNVGDGRCPGWHPYPSE